MALAKRRKIGTIGWNVTEILWGQQDKTLDSQDAQKFKQAIPHNDLVWIQKADHAPHIGQAPAVATAILSWT
jgi:pimeloyl-ACP methyl ester carboxylesterase